MRKNVRLTRHHLIPKSRNGVGIKNNIILWNENFHKAYHRVFVNDLPNEAIERILKLNSRALCVGFIQDIYSILDDYSNDAINPKCHYGIIDKKIY